MITPAVTIAISTFRESIRSKVLYSMLFFAAVLIAVSVFFGTVSIGERGRVVTDFGLFSLSFFSAIYSVIAGSTLLHKELSRKTIYNILARPISRWQFLVGKFLGLFLTSGAMLGVMTIGLVAFLYLLEGVFDSLLFVAALHIMFELMIVCAITIFFSAVVVTPVLSGFFSFGLFLTGRSAGVLREIFAVDSTEVGLGSILYYLLPDLDMLNISNEVVYQIVPSASQTLWGVGYSLCYCAGLMIVATIIFEQREFR